MGYGVPPIVRTVFKEGTLTADGTEQVVVLDDEGGPLRYLEGYISLKELSGANSVVIRVYVNIDNAHYEKYFERTYTGPQPSPVVYVSTKPTRYGIKVTLQQTVGLNRFDYQFFRVE